MRDLLYHACWLVLFPLAFYSAHLGILLWIWVALLPPTDFLYGRFGFLLPFNKLVAAAVFFVLISSQSKKDFYRDALIMFVSAYGLIVVLSYFSADYASFGADLQFDKFWKELVLFFLITGVMFTRHRLHQVALVTSLAFGFTMAKEGLIFLLTAGGHKVEGGVTTGDNNGLALALLMTIPLVLYCAKYTAEYWVRLGMYVTAGLGAVTVIATYSRGGFIGLIVLGLMLLKGSRYKVRALIATGVMAVVLYAMMPDQYLDRIDTIKEATADDSFATRLIAWKINFLLAMDHPFLGTGPYGCLIWQNWMGKMPEAATWLFKSPQVYLSFVAHSIYFQVLGDTGFVGLTLFLAVLGTALIKTVQTQRLARKDPSLEWAGDLARATQISMVVYCVSGAALSLVYFELLYVMLAVISRNHRTVRQLLAAQRVPTREFTQPALAPALSRAA